MPELKIQISDWMDEPAPARLFESFALDTVDTMAGAVAARAATAALDATSYAQRVAAFEDQFAAELAVVLGTDRDLLSSSMSGDEDGLGAVRTEIDWRGLVSGGAGAEDAARKFAATMVRAVLGRGMLEASAATDDAVVPPVYLAKGRMPEDIRRALRQEEAAHHAWRRALATAEAVLRVIGAWFSHVEAGGSSHGQAAHIGLALAELTKFGDQDVVSRKKDIKGAVFSVPVDPPGHLLAGPPAYDNTDLTVEVIPYVARIIAAGGVALDEGMVHADGGSKVILTRWHSTDSKDLERLTRLFRRLRAAVRKPTGQDFGDLAAPDLVPLLEKLGGRAVPGLPGCWRTSGDDVLGFRTVDHYRDGLLEHRRLQICAVLGLQGGQPQRSPIADELMRRGSVACWMDNGLVCVGYETQMPATDEDLRRSLTGFADFAAEIRLQLYKDQTVGEMLTAAMLPTFIEPGAPINDWIVRLRGLPVRLEVDFERMRRHWYRQRIVEDLEARLGLDSVEVARGLVAAVDNDDDRDYVRARFVMLLFRIDAEAALAELERVEFGKARHEATVEVLEAAVDAGQADLVERAFLRWQESDARRFDYESDCTSLLEQVASGLGLAVVHQGYGPETAPAVCCDWLNFILSRSPRSRRDPDWLSRLDALTNDEKALHDLHLDRLTDLFLAMQRHDLPGRRSVMAAIRANAAASPHLAYYEGKLNLSLHSPTPGSAA